MTVAQRSLIPTAILALVLLILLAAAGLGVRGYVSDAFDAASRVYGARELGAQVLQLQLDEETGIRGYAATHDRTFLEPYAAARAPLAAAFDRLRNALDLIQAPESLTLLADARATSDRWTAIVVAPVLQAPSGGALAIQLHGKQLMDHFRADMKGIDDALAMTDDAVTARARASIDRIDVLVGGIVFILLLAALAYGAQQVRVAEQLESEERRAEEDRRQVAELHAAFIAEKRIADTLQDAFVQRPLPLLPAMQFSATYSPAAEEARIGGDWYDAIELPGDRALFTIGDVTGHGIGAAVTMNQARQALISSALLDADPAAILTRINVEMARNGGPLVTAVAGYADARTYEFVYAVAGHPPPVLLEPGRAPRTLECGSLPLGAVETAAYRTFRVQTLPGATLILYTDGAVEHSRNVIEGEETLLRVVAGAGERDRADLAAYIHEAIFGGRPAGDDVAILTVGFAANPAQGLTLSADKAQTGFTGRIGRTAEAGRRAPEMGHRAA